MTFNTRTTHTQNQSDRLYGDGMLLTNVQCHRYLYPYHDMDNTGPYNWKHTWNQAVSNHIHAHSVLSCIIRCVYTIRVCGSTHILVLTYLHWETLYKFDWHSHEWRLEKIYSILKTWFQTRRRPFVVKLSQKQWTYNWPSVKNEMQILHSPIDCQYSGEQVNIS